ncbi:MAG: tripartite tricarboxylate transporter TctB family protein [Granulosicoccus sp.]
MKTMSATTTRTQHLVPAIVILVLAISVAYLSFTREPADAFLFPRFIGSVMLLLAIWNFLRAVLGMARIGDGLSASAVRNLLPGVVLMSVFALFAAKYLGFYVASWLAFLSVYSLYDPASHIAIGTWGKRVLITTAFMTVIYCLFTLLLKVQTPRGLFF